jgi:hypothetical protein
MTTLRYTLYRLSAALTRRLEVRTQPGAMAGHRVCSICDCRIRRHDRWHFGADRKPRHNDCNAPAGNPVPEMGRLL